MYLNWPSLYLDDCLLLITFLLEAKIASTTSIILQFQLNNLDDKIQFSPFDLVLFILCVSFFFYKTQCGYQVTNLHINLETLLGLFLTNCSVSQFERWIIVLIDVILYLNCLAALIETLSKQFLSFADLFCCLLSPLNQFNICKLSKGKTVLFIRQKMMGVLEDLGIHCIIQINKFNFYGLLLLLNYQIM